MRFDNYLTEKKALSVPQLKKTQTWLATDFDLATDEFLETVTQMKKECKYAMDLCRKNKAWFYRGLSGHARRVGWRNVRADRRPKDTDPYVHKMFDSTLEELFGWKARSQGLFVTSDYTQAKDFGRPMLVFPTGKFDYVWSPKEEDSINTIQDGPIRLRFGQDYKKQLEPLVDRDDAMKESIGNVANYYYREGIKGESKLEWVNTAIRDIMEKMVADDLDYSDTGIDKAMDSNHEIMVRSPKYYYFSLDYQPLLKLLVGM